MSLDETVLAYVQGSLPDSDRLEFEATLEQDKNLAAEVAALFAARRVMGETADDIPSRGWERLSERIDQISPPVANTNRPIWLPVAQAACIAVLSIVGWQVFESTVRPNEDAVYLPASDVQGAHVLQVTFAAQATVGDITKLLSELGATIIEGPSAIGLYRLGFVDGPARDAASTVLQSRDDLANSVFRQ